MGQPTAFLMDDSGKVRGSVGVVVTPRLVVFSPWPTGLGYPHPFVLRIVSDSSPGAEWHLPEAVEIVRLQGSAASRNVALVTTVDEIGLPGERVPGVDEAVVLARLTATADVRGTVSELLPPTFPRLGRRASPVAARTAAPLATGRPVPVSPGVFTVVSGPPHAAQRSICRIFRWD